MAALLKRMGGGGAGLKVLVVPPADPDVRETFTRILSSALGSECAASNPKLGHTAPRPPCSLAAGRVVTSARVRGVAAAARLPT